MNSDNKTNNQGNQSALIIQKIQYLEKFLNSQGLDMSVVLHETKLTISNIYESRQFHEYSFLGKLSKYFYNPPYRLLIDENVKVDELPKYEDL